eukprot:TRINITY_DN30359_c0_g1_i1.p1 TRINITY_DN30359_c0_g1~~TRINITY_DN30359_c0_g1_i1.p1  ORF type:complete len:233 (+),score=29.15 TRINITY_DN30359_c0_g1_i1:69-701(+)
MPKIRQLLGQRPPMPTGSGVMGDKVPQGTPFGGFGCVEVRGRVEKWVRELQAGLKKEWVYEGNGAKEGLVSDLHVSVLLRVPNMHGEAVKEATAVASVTEPVAYKLSPPVVTQCDRIKDRPVICITTSVSSPDLEAFRTRCFTAFECYTRYPGAGHITIAYLKAECKDEIEAYLASIPEVLNGISSCESTATHFTLRMRDGKVHQLPFST